MTYKASFRGIGEMLSSPEMQAEMHRRADKIAEAARASAPFDPNSTDGTHYRDAFSVTSGVRESPSRRAQAIVRNDDPAAVFVEYGTSHTDAHHTLLHALDAARD